MRRWPRVALRAAGAALIVVGAQGCAMIGGKTAVTDPKTGPGTDYPCGYTGVECADTMPHTCCPQHESCVQDDAGPYCEAYEFDPSDPTNMRRARKVRHERLALHE